jgi:hypothetical protein
MTSQQNYRIDVSTSQRLNENNHRTNCQRPRRNRHMFSKHFANWRHS